MNDDMSVLRKEKKKRKKNTYLNLLFIKAGTLYALKVFYLSCNYMKEKESEREGKHNSEKEWEKGRERESITVRERMRMRENA